MFAHLCQVETASDVSRIVTQSLEGSLSRSALALFRALHTVAVEVAAARGFHPGVSEVVIFAPGEQVARAVGISRATLYRTIPELKAAGLLDCRGHFTTLRGRTRADGMCWAVRLRPVGGRAARLSYDALKRQYRDLSGDISAGRTSWQLLRQSKDNPSREVNLNLIRAWALSPPITEPRSSALDCLTAPRRSLESVLDVAQVERGERSRVVNLAAEALAAALRDRGSTDFYRRLMWALLRRRDATGEDFSYQVYLAAQRASVDAAEGFARRPGALFVSRLKRVAWFGEVWHAPPVRVGGPPVEA